MRLRTMGSVLLHHRDFVQTDIPDGGPDNREATGLRREHINLIGALPDIAEETLDRIGRLNVPMHAGRECIKGQEMFFVLCLASYASG
jgi:hypothetical protein